MEDEIGIVAFPSYDDRKPLFPSSETPPKGGGGGSIAERRAAKFGFDAGKISTARFRTDSPMASPAARSPCLTIPPGISPTALLDSPIMLHNSLAMPSPTTGTFPFPLYHSVPDSATGEDGDTSNGSNSFKFEPYPDQKSLLGGSTFGIQETQSSKRSMATEQPCMGFEFPTEFHNQSITNYSVDPCNVAKMSNTIAIKPKPVITTLPPEVVSEQQPLSREPINGADISESNLSVYNPSGTRTSEDGYNWRKYGQKQVKGSEYPRSYYKCTHTNCQVKKKVERSHDGQITEIIYKGAHNHAKPQPNRVRPPGLESGFSFNEVSEVSEGVSGSVWTNVQSTSDGGLELTSSTSILTELSDPVSTTHGKSIGTVESAETPEHSSTFASHEDDEDGATQGSLMSQGGDADGEESESKRRKKESSSLVEATLTSRAVREPRVVVQIESEVDILDDGYRWRKYGQKVVKGNPNPRSYYKCTSAGCCVRKHVERASHNLKCVITTYEGKHNHEVPAARNGGNNHHHHHHTNSGGGASNNTTQPAHHNSLPRNPEFPKPETHLHDFPPHFDRKPDLGPNGYLRPGFPPPGCFAPPAIYQMKFPPYPPPPPFGLNPNRFMPSQANSMPPILPDFPISLSPPLPPVNLPLVGYNFSAGKPIPPAQPPQNDMRFVRPKLEQRDDSVYDAAPPPPPPSVAYNRIMGSFQS